MANEGLAALATAGKGDGSEGDGDGKEAERPPREEGQPSRHDWAGPASVITLFNCRGCSFRVVEGGADVQTCDEPVELFASFNLCGGQGARAAERLETFEERVEFYNEWLPWRVQEVVPGDASTTTLTIELRWRGKNQSKLLVAPWISYGCSVGARIKTASGFATVTTILDDDRCTIVKDNAPVGESSELDPGPFNVSRTSSPAYKAGQKLLLHDGQPIDAIVDEWLGVRRGSRHRVRIAPSQAGAAGAARAARAEAPPVWWPRPRRAAAASAKRARTRIAARSRWTSTKRTTRSSSRRSPSTRTRAAVLPEGARRKVCELPRRRHAQGLARGRPAICPAHPPQDCRGGRPRRHDDAAPDAAAAADPPGRRLRPVPVPTRASVRRRLAASAAAPRVAACVERPPRAAARAG